MLVSKVMLRPETYTIFYTCRRESTHAGERVHMQEKERERVNTAGHEHYSGEYTKWRFSFDVNRYKYGGRSRFLSRQEMN